MLQVTFKSLQGVTMQFDFLSTLADAELEHDLRASWNCITSDRYI